MSIENKIIHLINCDIKGGVEVGAKKAQKDLKSIIDYKIKFIYKVNDNYFKKKKKLLIKIYKIIKKKKNKKKIIIISSLWMSHIVCFILNKISNKFFWVSFIHSSIYATLFNKIICMRLTKFADKIIFDSKSTSNFFLKKKSNNKDIVNFYFQNKIKNFDVKKWNSREYDFIIIARNIKVKGYFEIEEFIKSWVLKYKSQPRLLIITNNFYKDIDLIKLRKIYKNKCSILLKKNIKNQAVLSYLLKSKIYICLSHSEGFGMSITEALISGCYIITTNVGEQKRYLYPKRRSLIHDVKKFDINYSKVNKIGIDKTNFTKAKIFLDLNVSYYKDNINKILSEINSIT